jgi:hypothetical protein
VLIAGGIGGYAGDLFDEGDTADAFVRKYDAAGNLLWTWEWATEVGEVASSISTDGLGNIFVSGQSFHGYWFALLRESIPGDYNGSGTVEQADLDLVLLNWGKDRSSPPAGWTASLPIGAIDQQELDAVLLNWGNAAGAVSIAAIPEPSGTLLALVCLACIGGVWAGGSVSCKKA